MITKSKSNQLSKCRLQERNSKMLATYLICHLIETKIKMMMKILRLKATLSSQWEAKLGKVTHVINVEALVIGLSNV